MKKILILGGSGRTGKSLIEAALEKEYEVTALVRSPEKVNIAHNNLKLIKGSPYNLADVKNAVTGNEAILVALNNPRKGDMPWGKPLGEPNIIAKSVENSLTAMKENNIKRIVALSAFGVGDSFQLNSWLTKFFIRQTNLKIVYQDHEAAEKLLRLSNTCWTTLRPVALSNSTELKNVQVSYNQKLALSTKISRKLVSNFMLEVLDNPEYFYKTPNIFEN